MEQTIFLETPDQFPNYRDAVLLAGGALSVYVGSGDAAMIIIMQLVWNIALWPLACACFRRSQERMVSYGG